MKLPRREFLHLAAHRHRRAPVRPIPVGKARPAIHRRDPAGRRRQYRDRSRDPHAARRLHAAAVNSQNAINVALYEKLNFDFVRDIAPVGMVESVPLVMEVHPSVPAKTVPEFIAYAKANPGKLNMASAGIGGPQHIAGELFKFMAGVDLTHIPYRGSTPAVTDLVAGQVQVMFDVTPTALPQIKAGTTRALGVTTKERLASLPDVPTIDSVLKGYEAAGWIGFGAPAATPPDIIATLNKQINTALGDPRIKQRLIELGVIPAAANSPGEFAKFIGDEIEKWSKVIKFAGIKPE